MTVRIRTLVVLVSLALASATALAAPRAGAGTADDSMTRYRTLASDALASFKAGDHAAAKVKARELEKAWDTEQKALRSSSPTTWKTVDDAMDAFIAALDAAAKP